MEMLNYELTIRILYQGICLSQSQCFHHIEDAKKMAKRYFSQFQNDVIDMRIDQYTIDDQWDIHDMKNRELSYYSRQLVFWREGSQCHE